MFSKPALHQKKIFFVNGVLINERFTSLFQSHNTMFN